MGRKPALILGAIGMGICKYKYLHHAKGAAAVPFMGKQGP
jgi:hypothetical protein